ncbi:universal stress protein [Streptomyces sp. WMMC940]|uniref:universal stress protein n=1 Tax=Streptomyces sp. WMMC940 TaxID=3015153 RepID=UPI0022B7133B|nr:universal stress protein [Streptomyces sp. WMMC940]MCZ7460432.1 universal stress protein [Streptomyces sp. WMMC940]
MPRTVTVGLDGSRESMAAVGWAAREALARGLPLRLVHVWDLAPDVHTPLIGPDTRRHWAERTPRKAAEWVSRHHPGLEVGTVQKCGEPAKALCEAAEEAELLVLGSRGLGAITGFVVGSVSLAVVARTGRPVVLVRSRDLQVPATKPPADDGDVVLGLDISHPCEKLLEFAFAHAHRHGAGLRVVHSWNFPLAWGPDAAAAAALLEGQVQAAKADALAAVLLPWRHEFPEVQVTEDCRLGRPAHDLPAAAHDARLVVVGRRSRTSSIGAHTGTVTHSVLHHCAAPVAVVPRD